MEEMEELKNMILSDEVLINDQMFQGLIILAQDCLDLDDMDCADLFDVGILTVNRWRNGVTTPSRVVRKEVCLRLFNLVRNSF
jgi:hypothetical protein